MDQLLEQRAELLVGAKLLRAGVLERMGTGTPDFECRWQHTEFGAEVTTRARPEAAWAMHDLLEEGLQGGPDVGVTLMRTDTLLFSESPGKTARIADQVIDSVKELVAAAEGRPVSCSIPIPQVGLTAMMHGGGSGPGMRVTYEPLQTDDQWNHHWKLAALQIKDTVEEKGRKGGAAEHPRAGCFPAGLRRPDALRGRDRQVPGSTGWLRPRQPRRRPGGPLATDRGDPGSSVLAR
jgi:hypothetical protein